MVFVRFCHYAFYKEMMFAFNIVFFIYSKLPFPKLHFLNVIYMF